ncbi:hypothetical protein PR003_g20588 [Phytophthora rubi]|uniref:Uncharacterized protein n=1 Tax=Phytophthora rubi TaxID=129364 RepID=A0A6A4DX76_9STRA|nr:hypothetical protein PR003_g20588 [Phytophthora rubi]
MCWSSCHTHEDALAAIQVQPAYFRRISQLLANIQEQLFRAHAAYRTICGESLLDNEAPDFLDRIRRRNDVESTDAAAFFEHTFSEKPRQDAALQSALSDLFLMVFAPSVYIDAIKIQAVTPDRLPPKRTQHAPFLLWSDLTLMCVARSDVCNLFVQDQHTPSLVVEALRPKPSL